MAHALIAEFHPKLAALYQSITEAHGLRTIVVRDGSAAKAALLSDGAPALLITALSLPRSSGAEVLREARRISTADTTAIILSTSFSAFQGITTELTKTFDIAATISHDLSADEIRRVVRRVLSTVPESVLSERPNPAAYLRKLLFVVAEAVQVSAVTVVVYTREERWMAAQIGSNTPATAGQDPLPSDLIQQVMLTAEPIICPDASQLDGLQTPPVLPNLTYVGFAVIPLVTSTDRCIGVLTLSHVQPLVLDAEQIDGLVETGARFANEIEQQFSDQLVAAASSLRKATQNVHALEQLAMTDPLTGLYNRRAGQEAIAREAARARRVSTHVSLALLDLDKFKLVNDVFGHPAGDRILAEVGRVLKSSFRESDYAVRWGGDEFMVILPDVRAVGAANSIERARSRVEAIAIGGGVSGITFSAGVIELEPDEDVSSAIRRVDMKLYDAKLSNRAERASD